MPVRKELKSTLQRLEERGKTLQESIKLLSEETGKAEEQIKARYRELEKKFGKEEAAGRFRIADILLVALVGFVGYIVWQGIKREKAIT